MYTTRPHREGSSETSNLMPPTDAKSMATQHFFTRRQLDTPITIYNDQGEELMTVFSVPRYPSDARQRMMREDPAGYQKLMCERAARFRSISAGESLDPCTNADHPSEPQDPAQSGEI